MSLKTYEDDDVKKRNLKFLHTVVISQETLDLKVNVFFCC
jgi:hypothetical protein